MSVRISAPETAKTGDVIELKALIQHSMESGFRLGARGETIPRDIITDFVCLYNGEEVFRWQLFPGIAANPFISFHTVASRSGALEFRWTDEHGTVTTETRQITVT